MRSPKRTVSQARTLRGSMSRSEVLLWVRLRARLPGEPTFRRQHPIGPYIADFYCSASKLVIEIDGGVHREEDRMIRDHWRDEALRGRGCRVLRIDVKDVLRDRDTVAERVGLKRGCPLRHAPRDTSLALCGAGEEQPATSRLIQLPVEPGLL